MTEKSSLPSDIRLMKKKKKNTCHAWRTESVKLIKHVPSFISFIQVNVFHPRAVPLIIRCVLLQGRSEIFLPRRDSPQRFRPTWRKLRKLTWVQSSGTSWSRSRRTSMTLNVKTRTLSPSWTSWGSLTSRPQLPFLDLTKRLVENGIFDFGSFG